MKVRSNGRNTLARQAIKAPSKRWLKTYRKAALGAKTAVRSRSGPSVSSWTCAGACLRTTSEWWFLRNWSMRCASMIRNGNRSKDFPVASVKPITTAMFTASKSSGSTRKYGVLRSCTSMRCQTTRSRFKTLRKTASRSFKVNWISSRRGLWISHYLMWRLRCPKF